MTIINSVLGPIDSTKLGFTLMHEHLTASTGPALTHNYPELFYNDYMEYLVNGLIEAKKGGIGTIVAGETLDLGRNVKLMVEASRRSGINVIACTGWYMLISRPLPSLPADQFAEMFIHDIQKGFENTDVKAGILKGASDRLGVTLVEEKILRGVARAHKQTGVPIMVHSYPAGHVGLKQLEILEEEGVDAGRVKIDHSNDTTDVEYLTTLLEKGCWLGMDRYPGRHVSPLARTKTLKALMDAGWGHRLLISHDSSTCTVRLKGHIPRERVLKQNPYGFLYISKVVFPWLREMGVSDNQLRSLVVDNPRNFFDGV